MPNKLALVLSLSLLACADHGSDPVVSAQTPTLTLSQQEQAVLDLASHPAFEAWASLTIELTGRMTDAHVARSPADLLATRNAAAQLVADADAGAAPSTLLPRLTAVTTITSAELSTLQARSTDLLQAFPRLHETGAALIGQAIEANPELRAAYVASRAHGDNRRSSLGDCYEDCEEEYISDHNQLIVVFGFSQLLCTGLIIFPPASIGCFIESAAQAGVSEADALIEFDDCIDDCNGEPQAGECESDADCPSDEWCDKGTLSIGDNKCKPDKSIGQVCSRDAKCLSGCCKYDFWQNPASMTCNPASDCN